MHKDNGNNKSALTEYQTKAAWAMEAIFNIPQWDAANAFHVNQRTLTRAYKRFGLPNPSEYRKERGQKKNGRI